MLSSWFASACFGVSRLVVDEGVGSFVRSHCPTKVAFKYGLEQCAAWTVVPWVL